MMDTYLTLLYVTLEQETALRQFFISRGWSYCKPDLSVTTDRVGLLVPHFRKSETVPSSREPVTQQIEKKSISSSNSQQGPKSSKKELNESIRSGISESEHVVESVVDNTGEIGEMRIKLEQNYESDDDPEDCMNDSDNADGAENSDDLETDENTFAESKETRDQVIIPRRGMRRKLTKGVKSVNIVEDDSSPENKDGVRFEMTGKRRKVASDEAAVDEEVMEEGSVISTVSRNEFTCEVCQKDYTDRYRLRVHLKVHDFRNNEQRRQFLCQYCNAVFFKLDNKTRHELAVHREVKNYACDICEKDFAYKWSLLQHKSYHHGVGEKHSCDKCKKQFSSSSNLRRHVQSCINGPRETCNICSKTFKTKASLQYHVKYAHKQEEMRECMCDTCGATFSRPYALKRHVKRKHDNL